MEIKTLIGDAVTVVGNWVRLLLRSVTLLTCALGRRDTKSYTHEFIRMQQDTCCGSLCRTHEQVWIFSLYVWLLTHIGPSG